MGGNSSQKDESLDSNLSSRMQPQHFIHEEIAIVSSRTSSSRDPHLPVSPALPADVRGPDRRKKSAASGNSDFRDRILMLVQVPRPTCLAPVLPWGYDAV